VVTYEEVTSLQRDLRDRFKKSAFQEKLKVLLASAPSQAELARKRQELMLEVQSVVLPRYGYEGSRAGVYKMMADMGPYVSRPEFKEMAQEINGLLGLRSPPETWKGLSRACGRASDETVAAEASAARERLDESAHTEAKSSGSSGSRPWPADKTPPFKLCVAGSWNDFTPAEMEWEDGLFVFPMEVGTDGWECFQLLQNSSWKAVVYPSMEEAGAKDSYQVCGPDAGGEGKSWQIGKTEEEKQPPGRFS